jgi:hypothetical protein
MLLNLLPYVLALASILTTRILHAFTVAEVLAVAAFVSGLAGWWVHRRSSDLPQALSGRLVTVASVLGLMGLPLKGLFVALGIGGGHDMTTHEVTDNALLVHIHHVFFNLGFLLLLVALVRGALARRGEVR